MRCSAASTPPLRSRSLLRKRVLGRAAPKLISTQALCPQYSDQKANPWRVTSFREQRASLRVAVSGASRRKTPCPAKTIGDSQSLQPKPIVRHANALFPDWRRRRPTCTKALRESRRCLTGLPKCSWSFGPNGRKANGSLSNEHANSSAYPLGQRLTQIALSFCARRSSSRQSTADTGVCPTDWTRERAARPEPRDGRPARPVWRLDRNPAGPVPRWP